jgi:hypothetical protein
MHCLETAVADFAGDSQGFLITTLGLDRVAEVGQGSTQVADPPALISAIPGLTYGADRLAVELRCQVYAWYYDDGWINTELGKGAKVAADTELASVVQPNGNENVFYVGPDGQVYNWLYTDTWTNSALDTNSVSGKGEPAEVGSGMTALYTTSPTINVFYAGANDGYVDNWCEHIVFEAGDRADPVAGEGQDEGADPVTDAS